MKRSILSLAALLGFVISGCGADGPDIGSVTGVVTLDGRPVEGAMIYFEPVKGGRSSTALTDTEGKYELKYIGDRMGALLGDHQVRITKFRKAIQDDHGKVTDKGMPEQFPKTANSESNLTAKVEPGDNVYDFAVVSK
ncbi:hypothetical protein Pan44_07240 [Caulifigura coniformis]|uniref:Carboxypeptidase regulatory-like domain-containing protein n=1 Tax=Caulifigura coniformis TaxID=2527983 RepID=A0A517S9D1_9PLAN|nr:carboxypeptidase-like regulatory domain-containing protein [Caulifigura coniformis]QDT52712.1 hypothetical protein Pan44_07240 [Caulifigura coniformis]